MGQIIIINSNYEMPRRYRLRRRRRFGLRRRYFRRTRTSFRAKVRRTLYQTAELKQGASLFALNSSNFYKTTFAPVSIAQGPGDNQRIGNVIRARNWQLKLNFLATSIQNPVGSGDGVYQMRLMIVWPRKFSTDTAAAAITDTTFPLFNMIDQDNWIIWYDKTFNFCYNGEVHPKVTQYVRVVFNKRFYAKLEFAQSSATIPTKLPHIVWHTNHPQFAFNWKVDGYVKVSYKDI